MHSNEFCNDYFSPVYFGCYMCAIASYMSMSMVSILFVISLKIYNNVKLNAFQHDYLKYWSNIQKSPKNMYIFDECGQFHSSECSLARSKSILYNVIDNDKEMPEILFCREILSSNLLEQFSFPRFCCNKFFIRRLSHPHSNGLFIKSNKQHKLLTWNK